MFVKIFFCVTPVKINVTCKDEKGLLAKLSAKISDEKLNITSAQISTTGVHANCIFEVDVKT